MFEDIVNNEFDKKKIFFFFFSIFQLSKKKKNVNPKFASIVRLRKYTMSFNTFQPYKYIYLFFSNNEQASTRHDVGSSEEIEKKKRKNNNNRRCFFFFIYGPARALIILTHRVNSPSAAEGKHKKQKIILNHVEGCWWDNGRVDNDVHVPGGTYRTIRTTTMGFTYGVNTRLWNRARYAIAYSQVLWCSDKTYLSR